MSAVAGEARSALAKLLNVELRLDLVRGAPQNADLATVSTGAFGPLEPAHVTTS